MDVKILINAKVFCESEGSGYISDVSFREGDYYISKTNTYELLIRDYYTKDLFHYTQKVGSFIDVLDRMYGFDIKSLTALIELITKSTSDDTK